MSFAISLIVLVLALALIWPVLGTYLAAVYEGRVRWLWPLERRLYKLLGVDPEGEQTWRAYALEVLAFSAVSILVSYAILRMQGFLPLNPQHLPGVKPALAWNTAVSFATTADWQAYSGQTTMSYLSQMVGLTVPNFVAPAVAMAVAIAFIRGLARRSAATLGSFWVDLVRGIFYVLVPMALVLTVFLVGQGAVQTLAGPVSLKDPLTGFAQSIPRGPVASMTAIEHLGDNGGGYFGANAAHPYANPTGLTNLVLVIATLAVPVSLTFTFGRMVGRLRQGVVLLAVMAVLFGAALAITALAEAGPNPAVAAGGLAHQVSGNMVGKETRFGASGSALYGVTSTSTGLGASNSSFDSFTPMGGFGLLVGMLLGDVSPGGLGSGLYGMLVFALVAVFLGGLMVGRTPSYLGKRIQVAEMQLAAIAILVTPLVSLTLTAIAVSTPGGRAGPTNGGPHGFTEILYGFSSMAVDNGSSFAGLSANTVFYDVLGGVAMLLGRYLVIVAVLGIAGSLAAKGASSPDEGTFRTDTPMFATLLTSVVVLVGGLTFVAAVALGPVVEQLMHHRLFP